MMIFIRSNRSFVQQTIRKVTSSARTAPDAAKESLRLKRTLRNLPKVEAERPKNPPNAYSLYVAQSFKKVSGKNPHLRASDVMRQLGRQWRELESSEKEKYTKEAAVETEKYKAKLNDYIKSRSVIDVLIAREKYRLLRQRGGKNTVKSFEKDHPDLPKPPPPAPYYFAKDLATWSIEKRQKYGLPPVEVSPVDSMKSYKTLPEELKSEYKAEQMKAWEEYTKKMNDLKKRSDVAEVLKEIEDARKTARQSLVQKPKKTRVLKKKLVKKVKKATKKTIKKTKKTTASKRKAPSTKKTTKVQKKKTV